MTRKPSKKSKAGTRGKQQRRSDRAKKDGLVDRLLSIDDLKSVVGGAWQCTYCLCQ